jgi:hypothetical protein
MFVDQERKRQAFRTVAAEWAMFGALLVFSAVMMGYFIWSERTRLIASNVERMRPDAGH